MLSLRYLLLFISVFLLTLIVPLKAFATPDPALTGGSTVTSYSGSAAPITDLQVTGTGNPSVPVKLHVTSGSLALGSETGLTFTGSHTGVTLQFTGSMSDVNAALATLTYTRTGTGSDTLEASLVNPGEVFFPENGHLYEYVSFTATWNNAKTNAEGRTKYGAIGYLTTITSQNENDFVAARLLNAGWMGASDVTTEGDWKWVTGPEIGTSFWLGLSGGSTVNGMYANWGSGEPNDSGSNEDCAQFLTGGTGKWNDLPCSVTTLPGYVVEYGSNTSPIDVSSKNVSITTVAANNYPSVPSVLGSSSYINGSTHTSAATSLSFTLSDSDGSDTLSYRIQIDDTNDFSSPIVDFTSTTATQGAKIFTVGQLASGGSYASGSAGQVLSDGAYYWRVKAIDNHAAESSYATANSGAVAFRISIPTPTPTPQPTLVPTTVQIATSTNCTARRPVGTPDLFQIDVNSTQATLYFAPVNGPVSNYYISYGYTSGDERFGIFTNQGRSSGVLSYTVNNLLPNMTYVFKIRPQNDCTPGGFGNEMSVTTQKVTGVAKRMYNGFKSVPISGLSSTVQILGAQTSCSYVVKPGDSLWSIAQLRLGEGIKYNQLVQKNNLSGTLIHTGQTLSLGC